MTDYIILFLKEVYILFIEMSPYLLLGMTVAGLLSIFVKRELVAKHVGGHNLSSVIKASLLGVPLPLCSCGVIPTASYLKKYGASKPAVMSFLISTPQTGVDSLTATWGMLGPLFAIFRAITALITGVAGGTISYLFDKEGEGETHDSLKESAKAAHEKEGRLGHFLNFAYKESVDDIAINFVIGLALAALISLLIPDNFFEGTLLGGGIFSMLLMVVIGIPMYVCSTSSIPIAVALILKGFSPGAAYVFLVAGPATNAATLAILMRVLGKKQTLFYLSTIVSGSLLFGLAMNGLTALTGWEFAGAAESHHMMFGLWDYLFAGFFAFLLGAAFYRKWFKKESCGCDEESCGGDNHDSCSCPNEVEGVKKMNEEKIIHIEGMNCHHCTATVKDALEALPGTKEVTVDLQDKKAIIQCDVSSEELKAAIVQAGYKVVE
jgi:uncharacterized protein